MALRRTTAPAEPLLSAADVRFDLRLFDATQDDAIAGFITAATEELDGKDGILGRALVTQQWELTLDRFPNACEFPIPLPPLRSVESITYVDSNGDTQTLDTSVYSVDTASEPGYVHLKYGQTWPATRTQRDAVTVAFTCGYGAADAVPERIKSAVKLKVKDRYDQTQDNREAVERLLFPFRVFG